MLYFNRQKRQAIMYIHVYVHACLAKLSSSSFITIRRLIMVFQEFADRNNNDNPEDFERHQLFVYF